MTVFNQLVLQPLCWTERAEGSEVGREVKAEERREDEQEMGRKEKGEDATTDNLYRKRMSRPKDGEGAYNST